MFEVAEQGHKVSKKEFTARERDLHSALLTAQRKLREADFPVFILISGVEGAGKGDVVSVLTKWLDVRGLETHAFWDETDEERMRPRFWRFWRAMPGKGRIGILFGSWYTRPIIDRALQGLRRRDFDREIRRIRDFEAMLVDDGALFIKLWFHLSEDEQAKRLEEDEEGKAGAQRISPFTKAFARRYRKFAHASERALRETDTDCAPWHIVEATNVRYRNLTAGEIVLARLSERLSRAGEESAVPAPTHHSGAASGVLDSIPLDRTISDSAYSRLLTRYQNRLYDLAWRSRAAGLNTVAVFEGSDASGKGGAIRRVTQAMDARLYRVVSIAAPTDEERSHHYLWRFWRRLPRDGYTTIFDRSWYGRVLVERVEGFASEAEWQRAYAEINEFEEQLVDHGTVLLKFWIHIDADEQLRRFREREATEWKRHKITDEDWRNREKWPEYEAAVSDMVARTSLAPARWTLVPGNDKRVARIEVLRTFCRQIERALDSR